MSDNILFVLDRLGQILIPHCSTTLLWRLLCNTGVHMQTPLDMENYYAPIPRFSFPKQYPQYPLTRNTDVIVEDTMVEYQRCDASM